MHERGDFGLLHESNTDENECGTVSSHNVALVVVGYLLTPTL